MMSRYKHMESRAARVAKKVVQALVGQYAKRCSGHEMRCKPVEVQAASRSRHFDDQCKEYDARLKDIEVLTATLVTQCEEQPRVIAPHVIAPHVSQAKTRHSEHDASCKRLELRINEATAQC